MEKKCVTVIGLGLIGGSLCIRLREMLISAYLVGVDHNPRHRELALKMNLVDEVKELEEAIYCSDVILVAIPVNAQAELMPKLLDMVSNQVVIDMASVKSVIASVTDHHPKRSRFVSAHPMWGTEQSGPLAARRDAFLGRAVVICDAEKSDADALGWTEYMFARLGMHIINMNSSAHDLHAAYISHISHVSSFALANTVLEKEEEEKAIFELASGGFESTVRLAGSNADMWLPIFRQNRDNLLDVLQEHINQLNQFKEMLSMDDEVGLRGFIKQANQIRRILSSKGMEALKPLHRNPV